MKTKKDILVYLFLLILLLSGCINKPFMTERDPSAGFNGSFEKTSHGLPVNWNICAPSDFQKNYILSFDTLFVKEGKQSLKFEVLSIDSTKLYPEWRAPGIIGSIFAETGDKFKISFWIKNNYCNFKIKVGSEGKGMPSESIVKSNEIIKDWKYYEYQYTVPDPTQNVRFELNIFSPGTFWIDDVRIEKINE